MHKLSSNQKKNNLDTFLLLNVTMNGVKGNSSLVHLKFFILESFCQSFTAKYATVNIACFVNNAKKCLK